MPITEKQRQRRQNYIGSSDSPRILGKSPFGDMTKVYYEKVLPLVEDAPTKAMDTGNRLEPVLLDFAQEKLGLELRRNQFRVAADGILAANFDALVVNKPEAVEAKYAGPAMVADWGHAGTDEVPEYVAIQVQHQMYVGNLELVHVPVFLAYYQPAWEIYHVHRNEEKIKSIVEQALYFWRTYKLAGKPPDPAVAPPIDLLRRVDRENGSGIMLDESAIPVVDKYQKSNALFKAAEVSRDEDYAAVVALLGVAERAALPDGRVVTYRKSIRRAYVVAEGTRHTLLIKPNK